VRIEAPRGGGRVWGWEGAVPVVLALYIQLTSVTKDDPALGRPPKFLTGMYCRVYIGKDRIVRALGNNSALHQKPV